MVDLWLFRGNMGEDWNFDSIILENGKRDTDAWTREMLKCNWIQKQIIPAYDKFENNDQSGNTVSLINKATQCLDYKESNYVNTINIYTHANYVIQAMYISDHNYTNSTEFNYFATIVNTESTQIFGPVLFFKIMDGKTVSLSINDLLCCLVNFYFVKSYKVYNKKFEEIAVRNIEYEIDSIFKSYHKKYVDGWVLLSDDKKTLENFLEKDNNINSCGNIVFFKLKNYSGDIHDQIKNTPHNKDDDFRGLYMDTDDEYIRKVFF
jgi:hypothetical protein